MSGGFARNPASPENDTQCKQTKEFDCRRTAVGLIRRMREAGFVCELARLGSENPH